MCSSGTWQELRLIGRGAQGTVHLVRGEDGTLRVAKRVDMCLLRERERQAAHRECGLLRNLTHPNIVQYVDNYEEDNALVLVMEWCQLGDLSCHIARTREANERFSDKEILRWFAQLSDALEYMHARRVLHRDLKSSNVFLTAENEAKLGDLGIAKILESTMAEADSVVGTPQYLSPELCENRPYSYSSDVWALGCVLYEMCALKRPFDASNLLGVVYCVVKADVDLRAVGERHPDLKALVSKLLIKDAALRPNAKDVVAETLDICARLDVARPFRAGDDDDAYPSDFDSDDSGHSPKTEAPIHVAAKTRTKTTRPERKSFKSVSETTAPPRPASTTGFLMERASRTPQSKGPQKLSLVDTKPQPFARSAKRRLAAVARRNSHHDDGAATDASTASERKSRSARTSRTTPRAAFFGSDSEMSPTATRASRVGLPTPTTPTTTSSRDDEPTTTSPPPRRPPPPSLDATLSTTSRPPRRPPPPRPTA